MSTRPPFDRIALILQGGGALGAYQAGVYQALDEAGLAPDWVAGISIGAINAALIAGNPPEGRVAALRAFWETVTKAPPVLPGFLASGLVAANWPGVRAHFWLNQMRAMATMMGGAPHFFRPRSPGPWLAAPGTVEATSFYDTTPLRDTLEKLVDFDRINAGPMRLSVGAVNVRSGNFAYFDTATHRIRPEHVMASGALPPGFPAVVIDGEAYWDGGLVSNTPLQWVLESQPRQDTLAFQVDLWSARGAVPRDLVSEDLRMKEIRYSSRTRAATDEFRRVQRLRRALHHALNLLPEEALARTDAEMLALLREADEKVYNIVHLIYRSKGYEGLSKDYEFSADTMREHWAAGLADARRSLEHPQIMERPKRADGVATFDVAVRDDDPGHET